MTGILLSIIIILGGGLGPTGDFNETTSSATTQTVNVKHGK